MIYLNPCFAKFYYTKIDVGLLEFIMYIECILTNCNVFITYKNLEHFFLGKNMILQTEFIFFAKQGEFVYILLSTINNNN